MTWVCRFCVEARSKWTTWFAMFMAALAGLPDVLPDAWAYVAYYIPKSHQEQVHHLLLAAGFLGVIYLRVRRKMAEPQ